MGDRKWNSVQTGKLCLNYWKRYISAHKVKTPVISRDSIICKLERDNKIYATYL